MLGAAAAVVVVAGIGLYWQAGRETTPARPTTEASSPAADTASNAVEGASRPPAAVPEKDETMPEASAETRSHVALLRFSADGNATGPVAFVSTRPRSKTVPRRLEMPLAEGRLVVALEDRARRELWRTVIADPRIVRGEFFDDEGHVEQAVSTERDGAASVVYPHREDAQRLVVFEPVIAADGVELRRLAALDLP